MQSTCQACRRAALSRRSVHHARLSRLQHRSFATYNRFFRVSEEVQQALSDRRPVVALESTIYTHGFPYPDNANLASHLETTVRLHGGVPATIGILDGIARVGLRPDELIRLASSASDPNASSKPMKLSRRDLGFALGLRDANDQPYNGGTTISATSLLAHLAGIRVFATGGLGGVHRGVEQTMDISADLTELGRTPIALVSSGCKSFLDIPRTLEYLETQGVAVATFADGRDGAVEFPAFFSRDSGVKSPAVVRDASEAARVIHAHSALGLQSGSLFANPIPKAHEVPFEQMEVAIAQAIDEANQAGATGAASTPYILDKIKELTGSRSLKANKVLVESNVVMGTKVAKALRELEASDDQAAVSKEPSQHIIGPGSVNYTTGGLSKGVSQAPGDVQVSQPAIDAVQATTVPSQPANVFVAGMIAVDLACDHRPRAASSSTSLEMHTSNPARIVQSLGGVAHNVARAATLMGADVRFCSAVGDDLSGKAALEGLQTEGIGSSAVKVFQGGERRTAQYVAVNEHNKDLKLAVADMSILDPPTSNAGQDKDVIAAAFDGLWMPRLRAEKPTHLVLDANWPPEYLACWLRAGREINAHITFEPVSNAKAVIPFELPPPSPGTRQHDALSVFPRPDIHLATPNQYELAAMHSAARTHGFLDRQDWWEVIDALGIPSTGARTAMALATSSQLVDQGIPQQSIQLLPFIPCIVTKLGRDGVLVTQLLRAGDLRLSSGEYAPHILSRCNNGTEESLGVGGVYMRLFPAVDTVPAEDIVSVNGVGDTFVGTLVAGLAAAKAKGGEGRVEEHVDLAQRAAVLTLKSDQAVSPGLGTLRMLM